jgi:hypothetical protein
LLARGVAHPFAFFAKGGAFSNPIQTDIKTFPRPDSSFIMVRAFQNAAQNGSSSVNKKRLS